MTADHRAYALSSNCNSHIAQIILQPTSNSRAHLWSVPKQEKADCYVTPWVRAQSVYEYRNNVAWALREKVLATFMKCRRWSSTPRSGVDHNKTADRLSACHLNILSASESTLWTSVGQQKFNVSAVYPRHHYCSFISLSGAPFIASWLLAPSSVQGRTSDDQDSEVLTIQFLFKALQSKKLEERDSFIEYCSHQSNWIYKQENCKTQLMLIWHAK